MVRLPSAPLLLNPCLVHGHAFNPNLAKERQEDPGSSLTSLSFSFSDRSWKSAKVGDRERHPRHHTCEFPQAFSTPPKNMEKHGYGAALGIAMAEIENPRKKGTSEEFSVCMVEAYGNAAFI